MKMRALKCTMRRSDPGSDPIHRGAGTRKPRTLVVNNVALLDPLRSGQFSSVPFPGSVRSN